MISFVTKHRMPLYRISMLWISLSAVSSVMASIGDIEITDSGRKVIVVDPEKSTGLDKIFVAYSMPTVSLKIQYSGGSLPRLYRFSNLGGAYSEEITSCEVTSSYIELMSPQGDSGYIVEQDGKSICFWITDYSRHQFNISSVSVSGESDCSFSVVDIMGESSPIYYYTINGQQKVLSREIRVEYLTQEYSEDAGEFVIVDAEKIYESISGKVMISPPAYCSTYFTISGDRFLREWGMERSAESVVVSPIAVDCRTDASQIVDDSENSNIIRGDDNVLGGSAPAEIVFSADVTEGVIHHEWQMGRDPDFHSVEYRFNEQNLTYVFNEEGTFYLQYIGSNSDGSCETFGSVYTVQIGASELLCPNAFSPNDDGINDVWKVSYRSLVDFHCWIFDRNGQEIYSFDKPDEGWDGKYRGKVVRPGVYYYVIQAEGADGKKYKKSGDINIIRSNSVSGQSNSMTQ